MAVRRGALELEGELGGDGIVLFLDWGGGYKKLHTIKWHRTIHLHCIQGTFLGLLLYHSCIKHNHYPETLSERAQQTSGLPYG